MQPYFFPYIGYFQLMYAVDVFVFYDDAQYIKGGWVNRNRILTDGAAAWLTFPISRDSLSLPINKRHYLENDAERSGLKRRLEASYSKAPQFNDVYPLICELIDYPDTNVAAFNANLLTQLAAYLGISCRFEISSTLDTPVGLRGQAKVINICRQMGAATYINPIGGVELYDAAAFAEYGIELRFLRSRTASYSQFGAIYVSALSIIDVLMFNSLAGVRSLLSCYELALPLTRTDEAG